MAFPQEDRDDGEPTAAVVLGSPVRYVPLDHVYSATSPFSASKMVKSSKVVLGLCAVDDSDRKHRRRQPAVVPRLCGGGARPPIVNVYSRRSKRPRHAGGSVLSLYETLLSRAGAAAEEAAVGGGKKRRGRFGMVGELVKLGVDSKVLLGLEGPRLRDCRNYDFGGRSGGKGVKRKKPSSDGSPMKVSSDSAASKRWVRLSFDGADPNSFTGLKCKVYWPLDADWYSGRVVGYDSEANQHQVKYEDGDAEKLVLSNERIKFYISREELRRLNLSCSLSGAENDVYDYDEMVVLAASLDDCQEVEAGDIIWAKLTGHAMWPAVVIDESLTVDRKGLSKTAGGRSVPVQFFGTHDFARIRVKQVISFLRGLLSSFHLKCKKPRFIVGLEEAKMYLSEQKLPERMLRLQNGINVDDDENARGEDDRDAESGDDYSKDTGIQRMLEALQTSPYVVGDLQVISLGKIVKDSECFHDDRSIWPEGYTALRKFTSITDPTVRAMYKMEVLRDAEFQSRPLFRVTLDTGEQFKGSTPSSCWNKIYKRMRKLQHGSSDGSHAEERLEARCKSGNYMFGFSNPEVAKLLQGLSRSALSLKVSMSKFSSKRYRELPVGYRPVRVDWKDLDKCSVCHMDEEYENNLFLQCDKCRMMVHARCYGEVEPFDGVLWLCNLCGPQAPEFPPPCCLCPVTGGAMKPSTDGRWAHLACAIWIPETCLSDVKKMQPIDGISRISKDRWKLLCSICGVSYGACIQCSNNTCRVAYHPLCARAAGLCVELEDEDRLHLLSFEDDEENQCIRLLSFCKRHKQPSNERSATEDRIARTVGQVSDFSPPVNQSGCARTEPYNRIGRRGRKEPEALAAASSKRLSVQNQPYLVSGHTQHLFGANSLPCDGAVGSKFCSSLLRQRLCQLDTTNNILSMAEKYNNMRDTFRKRLAFGKSGIHGFGIFTKHPHRAGDMVIEYTGELVRPPIADRRERFIYNSLVGAGTYMFRINDEKVIDATRAGSIAHLINHSCEPNCYSRVITVNGEEHIIIFAKRDIKRWEELTYDYRFFSIDEQLACYCGFPRCRGIVNDVEAEERAAKLYAPRSELTDWRGE